MTPDLKCGSGRVETFCLEFEICGLASQFSALDDSNSRSNIHRYDTRLTARSSQLKEEQAS